MSPTSPGKLLLLPCESSNSLVQLRGNFSCNCLSVEVEFGKKKPIIFPSDFCGFCSLLRQSQRWYLFECWIFKEPFLSRRFRWPRRNLSALGFMPIMEREQKHGGVKCLPTVTPGACDKAWSPIFLLQSHRYPSPPNLWVFLIALMCRPDLFLNVVCFCSYFSVPAA